MSAVPTCLIGSLEISKAHESGYRFGAGGLSRDTNPYWPYGDERKLAVAWDEIVAYVVWCAQEPRAYLRRPDTVRAAFGQRQAQQLVSRAARIQVTSHSRVQRALVSRIDVR